jgi:hypothetical protein
MGNCLYTCEVNGRFHHNVYTEISPGPQRMVFFTKLITYNTRRQRVFQKMQSNSGEAGFAAAESAIGRLCGWVPVWPAESALALIEL